MHDKLAPAWGTTAVTRELVSGSLAHSGAAHIPEGWEGLRRSQTQMNSSLSGMVVPVVLVLVFLLLITLMKECARMLWRRALLRTINHLRANQQVMSKTHVRLREGMGSV